MTPSSCILGYAAEVFWLKMHTGRALPSRSLPAVLRTVDNPIRMGLPMTFDREVVRTQAEQDQVWMDLDEWYADADKDELLAFVNTVDASNSVPALSDSDWMVCRGLIITALIELALRNLRED